MPASVCCLTEVERAWLAAIMDADGCISIHRSRRGKTWRYWPCIEFTNTNKDLVDKYIGLVKPWVTRVREYGNNHFCENAKRRFQVEVRHRHCEDFIHAIRPYLVGKGHQADLMIEFVTLQETKGRSTNQRMVDEYNELYIRSRLLNKRGVKPLDVDKLRQDIAA